mgnify:FL=1
MGFFKNLFAEQQTASQSEAIRQIRARLDDLPANEADYLAAFSFLLARVARADLKVDQAELKSIEEFLSQKGRLSAEKASLVADLVKNKNEWLGATENYVVAREFKAMAGPQQKIELLHCLFSLASADGSISAQEENEIKKIARELQVADHDFIEARSMFREKRSALKGMVPKAVSED